MKSKILSFIFCTVLASGLSAQSIQVQYKMTPKKLDQKGLGDIDNAAQRKKIAEALNQPQYYRLQYRQGASLYINNTDEYPKKDEPNNLEEIGVKLITISASEGLYKNFKTNEYRYSKNILTKPFLIIDTLQIPHWKITGETDSIGGYKTQKATAIIDGKKVMAWYSDEIPVSDGPANYYGLPGLILKTEDEGKTYEALKISTEKDFEIVKPTKGKQVNRETHKKIYDQKIKELKSNPSKILKF